MAKTNSISIRVSKQIILQHGDIRITGKVNPDHVEFDKTYCFKSTNDPKTFKRWRNVLRGLLKMVDVMERESDN